MCAKFTEMVGNRTGTSADYFEGVCTSPNLFTPFATQIFVLQTQRDQSGISEFP